MPIPGKGRLAQRIAEKIKKTPEFDIPGDESDWVDIYHGTEQNLGRLESRPMWADTDPITANSYAAGDGFHPGQNVQPMRLNINRAKFAGDEEVIEAAFRQGHISEQTYRDMMSDSSWNNQLFEFLDPQWGGNKTREIVDDLTDQGYDVVNMKDSDLHGRDIESWAMLDPRRLNDAGILKGKFTDKLAVAGTGGVMADDNWSFIEESAKRRQRSSDARSLGRLEEINREGPSIYGPEHPRLLGGLSAVRNLPGADFLAGGLFDVAEDYAYGDESTMEEKIGAGLDVAGILPIGAAAGMVGKGIGRGIGRLMGKTDDVPKDRFTDSMDDVYEEDSVIDAIREMFGPNSVAEQRMAREPGMMDVNLSPDMTRKGWQGAMEDLRRDPTNIQLQDELGGYGRMLRNQRMQPPGASAFDESPGRLSDDFNVTDEQWANFQSYVSTR